MMNLRQRRGVASPSSSATSVVSTASSQNGQNGIPKDNAEPILLLEHNTSLSSYWLHGVCLVLVTYGTFLCFRLLYTTEECDMTWSRRQFLHIEMPNSTHNQDDNYHHYPASPKYYRLYKFFDQRDPRHAQFLNRTSTRSNDHCTKSSSHAVLLYVPGHFGSFEQSRSLGAHGTQWTGKFASTSRDQNIAKKLQMLHKHQTITSTATKNTSHIELGDFFYDVYALDFREEGGAFHSKLLWRQAAFLARAIEYLTATCQYPTILIFAHSMGGISTRIALQQYPYAMSIVQNVITVGSPHTAPVLTLEPGMLRWYFHSQKSSSPAQKSAHHSNNTNSKNVLFISISGGLRDEMIPPIRCGLTTTEDSGSDDDDSHFPFYAWSILATDMMQPGVVEARNYVPPMLGVDHRGIVWCHNLLSEVRRIIFALVAMTTDDNTDPKHRLERVQQTLRIDPSYDYGHAVHNLRNNLQKKYGFFRAFVMETSLLYNAELLVKLHGYLGAFYYTYPYSCRRPLLSILRVVLAALLQYSSFLVSDSAAASSISFLSILILSFVVDAIFVTLCRLLVTVVGKLTSERTKVALIGSRALPVRLVCVLAGGYVATRTGFAPKVFYLRLQFLLFLVLALGAILTSFTMLAVIQEVGSLAFRTRHVHFVVWSLVFLPLFFMGDFVIFFDGIDHPLSVYAMGVTNAILEAKTAMMMHETRFSGNRKDASFFEFCRFALVLSLSWEILKIGPDSHSITETVSLHPLLLLVLGCGLVDIAELGFATIGQK